MVQAKVDVARRSATRVQADEVLAGSLRKLAIDLAAVWARWAHRGRSGPIRRRSVPRSWTPASICSRSSPKPSRHAAHAIERGPRATPRRVGVGRPRPDADFAAEQAAAVPAARQRRGAIEELETQIARASDVDRELGRGPPALGQAAHRRPQAGRFLAFLLEEERAELAELGSGLFETLTDGNYRFAADDTFDILDLNAADRTRKADSLSGGETFLASLALALALAEMVARGGVRRVLPGRGLRVARPEHLDRAMTGIERLVAEADGRLVVLVSHVAEMREAIEDLVVLDKAPLHGRHRGRGRRRASVRSGRRHVRSS